MSGVSDDAAFGFVMLIILVVVGGLIYLLPVYVAEKRRHANRGAILVLNLALGWTFLGWVIALVWANTANVEAGPSVSPYGSSPNDGDARAASMHDAGSIHHTEPQPAAVERTCPHCAETIKAAAVVCKHCGRDVPKLADT